MDIQLFTPRSPYAWEIPRHGAMRVPAVIFGSEDLIRAMDGKVYEQTVNVATLPGIVMAAYAMPDAHFDCVAVLKAVQHADDWREAGAELLRVMKPGRRIVLAEAALFGGPFWARVEADVHLQYWVDKLTWHRALDPRETSYYSPEELHRAFAGLVEDAGNREWRGIELFWGRKPGAPAAGGDAGTR